MTETHDTVFAVAKNVKNAAFYAIFLSSKQVKDGKKP
jgi:hypothetical protein